MKRLDMTSATVLLLALGLFTGCGDDSGDGGGGAGAGGDGDGVTMEVIEPTYTNLRERVFDHSCSNFSGCHDNAGPPAQGLDLATDPIAALVGVESTAVAGKILVIAGDADNSYLIEKISQMMPTAGNQMPAGQPLTQNKIDALRAWIDAGANPD